MAKKSATKKRQLFAGSEGNPDYLVIARQNGYVLGIKPLLMISGDISQYGFRLRMQKSSGGDDKVHKLESAEKDAMLKAFPEIPWSKRSTERFSTMLMRQAAFGWEFRVKMLEEVKEKLVELLDEVIAKIKPIVLLNEADAMNFLTEGMDAVIELIENNQKKEEESDEPSGAEVLVFPGMDKETTDI